MLGHAKARPYCADAHLNHKTTLYFPKPIKNAKIWENKVFKFPKTDIFYTFAGK